MPRYKGDPRWITVKYAAQCAKCETKIARGARAYYMPNGRRMLCAADACGGDASREFNAAAFDEDFGNW